MIEGGGRTIAALVKAVGGVAVVGEDDDSVAALLEADGGIDDETFSAADAEVGMEEDDGGLGVCLCGGSVGGHDKKRWWW